MDCEKNPFADYALRECVCAEPSFQLQFRRLSTPMYGSQSGIEAECDCTDRKDEGKAALAQRASTQVGKFATLSQG